MVSRNSRMVWVVLGVFATTCLSAADKPSTGRPRHSAAKTAASPRKRLQTGEAAIEKALQSPTVLEFVDTPLTDVIDYLKDYHQIEIQLDKKAMDEAGIDPAVKVTKNLKGVTLKSALRLMLRDLGLTYLIKDEVLLITTTEAAENQLTTRIYPVADLVIYLDDQNAEVDDYEPLIEVIRSTICPTTWDEVGGPGTVVGDGFGTAKMLVVSQTYEVHEQIAQLLKNIREVVQKSPRAGLSHLRAKLQPATSAGGGGGMY